MDWALDHRNSQLEDEFVHLLFAENPYPEYNDAFGLTYNTFGSYVFIENTRDQSISWGLDFHTGLSTTVAHELTHSLLNTAGANSFNDGEHLLDPNGDGNNNAADFPYLMYETATQQNWVTYNFEDFTRLQLDLNSKESVERK